MVNLMKVIVQKIKSVHPRVYLGIVPDIDSTTQKSVDFPYITYRFPTSNDVEMREDFILEVDIWDDKSDTTALETLTDNIDKALNREKYIDNNLQVSIYRINRLMIDDPDPKYHRRQLRYLCKTYFVG